MGVSLTELRQRLFVLADQVIDTGEPLVVVRRGVRLRLMRDDTPTPTIDRMARLRPQELVIGPPLRPDESPAEWRAADMLRVAEAPGEYETGKRRGRRRGVKVDA